MRADNANAFALEDGGQTDQKAVVARAKQLRELRRSLHRSPVEPQIGEFGAGHRADDHHLADRALFQRREQLADLAHPHPNMRIGLDPRLGRPDHADQERLASGPRASAATSSGNPPRAAEDRQGGTQPADPPGRRSTRSRLVVLARARNADRPVAALPKKRDDLLHGLLIGEASATSLTRSFRVPLPSNSIL